MRIILGASESLTAVMSGAAATTNPTYIAEWQEGFDVTQPTGSLSGATAVTLVNGPTSGRQRTVLAVSIYNADTSSVTVTLAKVSGGTSYSLLQQIIPVGATLIIDAGGVYIQKTDGATLTFGTATTITFAGATGTNIVAVPDNLASAFTIKEGSTAYFTVVTTDSAEKIDIAKDLLLSGGSDLTFTGTTGQPQINLTTNLADALSIVDTGVGDMMVFCTTTSGSYVSMAGRMKFGSGSTLTIASGAVTATSNFHLIAGEGGAADDLDTISGGVTGQVLVLQASSDSVTITATENGNLDLGGATRALDNANDTLTLLWNGTKWCEIAFSSNGT